jgi:hypothetical protein
VRTLPPGCPVASRTSTSQPASDSRLAATRPLWPAPTTTASATGAQSMVGCLLMAGFVVGEPLLVSRIIVAGGSGRASAWWWWWWWWWIPGVDRLPPAAHHPTQTSRPLRAGRRPGRAMSMTARLLGRGAVAQGRCVRCHEEHAPIGDPARSRSSEPLASWSSAGRRSCPQLSLLREARYGDCAPGFGCLLSHITRRMARRRCAPRALGGAVPRGFAACGPPRIAAAGGSRA